MTTSGWMYWPCKRRGKQVPSKFELASYLVNLHNLLEAQEAAGSVQKSTTLAEEYEKNWSLLKSTITKENSDEARNRNHRDLDEG